MTIWSRSAWRKTIGVAQELGTSRGISQTVLPVAASRASSFDLPSFADAWSNWTSTRFLYITSDEAWP